MCHVCRVIHIVYDCMWFHVSHAPPPLHTLVPAESIYKVPGDDTQFYAVFTTSMNGLMGSAICSFTLRHIQVSREAARFGRVAPVVDCGELVCLGWMLMDD